MSMRNLRFAGKILLVVDIALWIVWLVSGAYVMYDQIASKSNDAGNGHRMINEHSSIIFHFVGTGTIMYALIKFKRRPGRPIKCMKEEFELPWILTIVLVLNGDVLLLASNISNFNHTKTVSWYIEIILSSWAISVSIPTLAWSVWLFRVSQKCRCKYGLDHVGNANYADPTLISLHVQPFRAAGATVIGPANIDINGSEDAFMSDTQRDLSQPRSQRTLHQPYASTRHPVVT